MTTQYFDVDKEMAWYKEKADYRNNVNAISKFKEAKRVNMIDSSGEVIKSYSSAVKAARDMKVHPQSIRCAINGHREFCKGFKWEYEKF